MSRFARWCIFGASRAQNSAEWTKTERRRTSVRQSRVFVHSAKLFIKRNFRVENSKITDRKNNNLYLTYYLRFSKIMSRFARCVHFRGG